MPSTNSAADKAIIAYVPALHAGYLKFFNTHKGAPIFVLGKSFIDAYPRLNRDLRALEPLQASEALRSLGFLAAVLEITDVARPPAFKTIVLPDEDVSRDFSAKHLQGINYTLESIFLRWDGVFANKTSAVTSDRTIDAEGLERELMREAYKESKHSADWWRQIGGLIVKDDTIVARGHIRHFPSDLSLDIFGTPRITVDAGERPDLYISMHAEADLVAQAAKEGVELKGASLYTTTFPCINCAFLIARSGIARVYYAEGYSKIDAESILKNAGIEIVLVTGV
jgi:dCMP deaminase